MKVLATYSIKGGVGKTSTAVNLAAAAAREGSQVLLWDLDPQGAATFLFRVSPKVRGGGKRLVRGRSDIWSLIRATDHERLDLLPSDFSYRHMDLFLGAGKRPTRRLANVVAPLAEDYDLVVLDCPPSISLVSENVFRAADALLVPLVPTPLSMRTLEQLEVFLGQEGLSDVEVLPFLSMVDGGRPLHREAVAALRAARPGILAAEVPLSAEVEAMGVHRDVVAGWSPAGEAAAAYAALWAEIRARLGS